MNFPKLHIQSTPARLGLNIQKPVQRIEQPRANLDIQQPQAIQTMKKTDPRLSIDTTEARADIDLKSGPRRVKEFAAEGLQAAIEGVGRRAQEGMLLMKIENGGNAIYTIAKQSGRQPYSSLGIKFVPSYGSVKVDFEPGSIDIQVEPQKVINNSKANKPIIDYTPGKVTGEMLQHASLKIDWII